MQIALRMLGAVRMAGAALRVRRSVASRSGRRYKARPTYDQVRSVPSFDRYADDLFTAHAKTYAFVGDRRLAALDCVYPTDETRYLRIVVEKDGQTLGWAVLLDTSMRDDKYFGDMRVGTLADCFAAPDHAPAVVGAADDVLTGRGVDIVISNQLHHSWCNALAAAGYEKGPSNFFFYFSEDLAQHLDGIAEDDGGAHLNRGDGEGPAHL